MGRFNKKVGGDGDGHLFVKLKDGEHVVGVQVGDVREYYTHFVNRKPEDCTHERDDSGAVVGGSCVHCAGGNKVKFRFTTNFVVNENGAFVAKLLNQGPMVYDQINELVETGWDLDRTWIRVSRKGSGMNDTEYAVNASPKLLTDEQLAQIKQVELNSVYPKTEDTVTEVGEDDVPF